MNSTLNDLQMILSAIELQRRTWQLLIATKYDEAITMRAPANEIDAAVTYSKVLTSSEVTAEHTKLINLYGCLGSQTSQYLTAIQNLNEKVA
jgi:hypothetical protein